MATITLVWEVWVVSMIKLTCVMATLNAQAQTTKTQYSVVGMHKNGSICICMVLFALQGNGVHGKASEFSIFKIKIQTIIVTTAKSNLCQAAW